VKDAVLVKEGGGVICERCTVAASAPTRMKGLLGRSSIDSGEGLLLRPAGSVHTAFMRFPIDVVFLDRELRVVGIRAGLRPWRAAAWRRARAVVELRAGECKRRGIQPGQQLQLLTSQNGGPGSAVKWPGHG
jgi:uncharacterized membrane protein (UPF0127 family)